MSQLWSRNEYMEKHATYGWKHSHHRAQSRSQKRRSRWPETHVSQHQRVRDDGEARSGFSTVYVGWHVYALFLCSHPNHNSMHTDKQWIANDEDSQSLGSVDHGLAGSEALCLLVGGLIPDGDGCAGRSGACMQDGCRVAWRLHCRRRSWPKWVW